MSPAAPETGPDPAPVVRSRGFAAALVLAWAVLTLLELGWIPPLRYAWAYNFWQYLHPAASPLLAVAGLALCLPAVRSGVIEVVRRASAALRDVSRIRLEVVAFVAIVAVLWLLRERYVLGDAFLLIHAVRTGYVYLFPELGATFLLWAFAKGLGTFGVDVLVSTPLLSCVFGALTVLLLARAGTALCNGRSGRGVVLAAIVLSSGLLRVFAGHVEVYAALLAAASAYLWASVEYVHGRTRLLWPALALGMTIWVHVAGVLLAPSLAALPWIARPAAPWSERWRDLLWSAVLCGLPVVVFLLLAWAIGPQADFDRLVVKILEVLGLAATPEATSWWVRLSDQSPAPTLGIGYVLLSFAHLKYLANAFHVLAAGGVAVVVATLVLSPARLRAPEAVFLIVATGPQLVYSLLLRPFWGPFDWDLFAGAGFFVSVLGAWVVCTWPSRRDFEHVALVLVGFQLLFVSGPFVALALGEPRDAGPFVPSAFQIGIGRSDLDRDERIGPWL